MNAHRGHNATTPRCSRRRLDRRRDPASSGARPRSHLGLLLLAALSCGLAPHPPVDAADFAAAYLQTGVGARGPGMGGAFIAVADDASAPYWNPAGLATVPGKAFLASHQPLSLDRKQNSVSVALNLRRELGFGFTWLHAGVDGIPARAADGRRLEGEIADAENAYYVAVGRAVGSRLAVGLAMKVLEHRIAVPLTGESSGKGHGFDLGARLQLTSTAALAAVVRNLDAELGWKVDRGNQQTSDTQDRVPAEVVLGAAHRPFAAALIAADLHLGPTDPYLNLGAEWRLSPVLTVRGGLNRMPGDDRGVGSMTAGLTLRPMRRDAVRFSYTYATDEVAAGGRTYVGLALGF